MNNLPTMARCSCGNEGAIQLRTVTKCVRCFDALLAQIIAEATHQRGAA